MTEQPTVRASGVCKEFMTQGGRVDALVDVDLVVERGEFVSLIGPSGCGKSTLLRLIADLLQPTRGELLVNGKSAHQARLDQDYGMAFQQAGLFEWRTVSKNVELPLELRKVGKPQRQTRSRELLELVQLSGLKDRFPGQISGGQRQRVALARALAVDPRVLLLDEPFGALDANVRRDLRRWLRKIHDELGITTLFVTHDQEEALDLADRVVILNKGRIVQEGTPETVCRNPADAFVMNFLGDANRLDADIRGGRAYVEDVAFEAEGVADGGGQILFRPADVTWREDGEGIAAKIVRVIDRPDSRRVLAMTGSGQAVEFDTAPEFPHRKGEAGFIEIRRPRVYAAA